MKEEILGTGDLKLFVAQSISQGLLGIPSLHTKSVYSGRRPTRTHARGPAWPTLIGLQRLLDSLRCTKKNLKNESNCIVVEILIDGNSTPLMRRAIDFMPSICTLVLVLVSFRLLILVNSKT